MEYLEAVLTQFTTPSNTDERCFGAEHQPYQIKSTKANATCLISIVFAFKLCYRGFIRILTTVNLPFSVLNS